MPDPRAKVDYWPIPPGETQRKASLGTELVPTGIEGEQLNWFKYESGRLVEVIEARGQQRFKPTVPGWYYFTARRNHTTHPTPGAVPYGQRYDEATQTFGPWSERGHSNAITGGIKVE